MAERRERAKEGTPSVRPLHGELFLGARDLQPLMGTLSNYAAGRAVFDARDLQRRYLAAREKQK